MHLRGTRITVSFNRALYRELEVIANEYRSTEYGSTEYG